jgi:hypothetical protein
MWEYLGGMARVILDTNNVLGATDALPTEIAGPTPQEFVDLLVASRRYPGGFLLVCDGVRWNDAPKTVPSGIQVRFSGHGVTADDVIARVVSQSSISRHLLVVTTDRALQKRVKRLKASTMDSKAFLEELGFDWQRTAQAPQLRADAPELDPNAVLPPEVVAEAETVRPQKGDTSPSIWAKLSAKVLKNQKPVVAKSADEPPVDPAQDPTHDAFCFDPKTLEDAERIAKGHSPNDP